MTELLSIGQTPATMPPTDVSHIHLEPGMELYGGCIVKCSKLGLKIGLFWCQKRALVLCGGRFILIYAGSGK